MRAALHTHGLKTGAAALGALNYASRATEMSIKWGEHTMEAWNRHGEALWCLLSSTSTPALRAVRQA